MNKLPARERWIYSSEPLGCDLPRWDVHGKLRPTICRRKNICIKRAPGSSDATLQFDPLDGAFAFARALRLPLAGERVGAHVRP